MKLEKLEHLSIDLEISSYLKAIAILFVIAGHILGGKFGLISNRSTAILGTGGVNVFLILSGYGVYTSYQTKGLGGKNYWNKKITKIFLPYMFVTFLYYIYLRLNGVQMNDHLLLLNLLCIDFTRTFDGTMWYMSFLLIWYILFYIVFYLDYPKFIKIGLLFLLSWSFENNVYKNIFGDCNWQFSTNAYAFSIGAALGYVFEMINRFIKNVPPKRYYLPVLAAGSLICLICGWQKNTELNYYEYGLCYLTFFSSIFCMTGKKSRLLRWIGANSFILYLVEAKLLVFLSKFRTLNQNVFVFLFFYIIFIYLIVQSYHFIYPKLTALCQKYKL